MKNKWILLFLCLVMPIYGYSQDIPGPPSNTCILDKINALTQGDFKDVEKACLNFNDVGKGQIGVLIIDDLQGLDIADYSQKVFDSWKIGHKDLNDGILIVLKTGVPGQKKIRIHTGYGIEGMLPDGRDGEIIRSIAIPKMKVNDWHGALVDTISTISRIVDSPPIPVKGKAPSSDSLFITLLFPIGLIGTLMLMIISRNNIEKRQRERSKKIFNDIAEDIRKIQPKYPPTPWNNLAAGKKLHEKPNKEEKSRNTYIPIPIVIDRTPDYDSSSSYGSSSSYDSGSSSSFDFGGGSSGGGGADGSC